MKIPAYSLRKASGRKLSLSTPDWKKYKKLSIKDVENLKKSTKKIDDFFTVTQNNVVTEDSIDSSNNSQIICDDDSNIEIKHVWTLIKEDSKYLFNFAWYMGETA